MNARDVVVVGASAGGVEALRELASRLPPGFPASVFVALHMGAGAESVLPEILTRCGPLEAVHATDGTAIVPGRVYVAPPDRHLLLEVGRMRVRVGPRRNHHRPSIDTLFESAGQAYRERGSAVVLSGSLDDGTAGLIAVKRAGGSTLVQDPAEATWPEMPRNALARAPVDYCLPIAGIAETLASLATGVEVSAAAGAAAPASESPAAGAIASQTEGTPSVYTCPECSGTLWLATDGGLERLTCRVGHSYTPEAFLAEQDLAVERALWVAYRTLQERLSIQERMARDARLHHREDLARIYDQRVRATSEDVNALRGIVFRELEPPTEAAS
jgi:two-component system chemotaxis response regulator CheB